MIRVILQGLDADRVALSLRSRGRLGHPYGRKHFNPNGFPRSSSGSPAVRVTPLESEWLCRSPSDFSIV